MSRDEDGWLRDASSADEVHLHRIRREIYEGRSRHQHIRIVELEVYGRALVLDGRLQAAERDEFVYHESLVQPAMVLHPNPLRVLVLGGGEGATAREVLRHASVRRCTMVDLDGAVVGACKEHLPTFHRGAFDDPRLELIVEDAVDFLAREEGAWDVIVYDLTEPLEGGPAEALFTLEFFELARERLAPGGLMAIQAGSAAMAEMEPFAAAARTLALAFGAAHPYVASVPSFSGPWGFVLCAPEAVDPFVDPTALAARIRARAGALGHYTAEAHAGMFRLPGWLRAEIQRSRRILTKADPGSFRVPRS